MSLLYTKLAISMISRYTPIRPSENMREDESRIWTSFEWVTCHAKETMLKDIITAAYNMVRSSKDTSEIMSLHDPNMSSLSMSGSHTTSPATQHISGTGTYTTASLLK